MVFIALRSTLYHSNCCIFKIFSVSFKTKGAAASVEILNFQNKFIWVYSRNNILCKFYCIVYCVFLLLFLQGIQNVVTRKHNLRCHFFTWLTFCFYLSTNELKPKIFNSRRVSLLRLVTLVVV